MTTFIIILAVVATIFWLVQLLSLMMMPDDAFPGRYDKPIWAAILLVLSVLGAFLFVVWKFTAQSDHEAAAVAGQIGGMIRQAHPNAEAT